jgi:hypothetical protein
MFEAYFWLHSQDVLLMSESNSLSIGQAQGRWVLYVLVFVLAGGVAAGAASLVYEAVAGAQNPVGLYAVIFAASGYIAYRLAERVLAPSV